MTTETRTPCPVCDDKADRCTKCRRGMPKLPEPRYTREEEKFWDEQVARIFRGAQR